MGIPPPYLSPLSLTLNQSNVIITHQVPTFLFSGTSPPLVTNIKIHNIGIHSFNVSWNDVPVYSSVSETKGYKIVYYPLADIGGVNPINLTVTVNGYITNYEIVGLERNQTYCVQILAYNEFGDGEITNCTNVTTAQGNLSPFSISLSHQFHKSAISFL